MELCLSLSTNAVGLTSHSLGGGAAPPLDVLNVTDPVVMTNLTDANFFEPPEPFANMAIRMGPWSQKSGMTADELFAAGHTDRQGRIVSFPTGTQTAVKARVINAERSGEKAVDLAGTYRIRGVDNVIVSGDASHTVTDNGSGEWEVVLTEAGLRAANTNFTIEVNVSTFPVALPEVVHQRNLTSFDAGDMWDQSFLESRSPLYALRHLDTCHANESLDLVVQPGGASDLTEIAWANRVTTSIQDTETWGWPVEWLVDLHNRTGTHFYMPMPYVWSADHIREFAEYVRDNLRDGLKLIVEWGNEPWNDDGDGDINTGAFRMKQFYINKALADWSQSGSLDWIGRFAKDAVRMAEIVNDVFAGNLDRCVTVLAFQARNASITDDVCEAPSWKTAEPDAWKQPIGGPTTIFDAFSVATYYGNSLPTVAGKAPLNTYIDDNGGPSSFTDLEGLAAVAVTELTTLGGAEGDSIPNVQADILAQVAQVQAYDADIAFIMYEGGRHFFTTLNLGDAYDSHINDAFALLFDTSSGLGLEEAFISMSRALPAPVSPYLMWGQSRESTRFAIGQADRGNPMVERLLQYNAQTSSSGWFSDRLRNPGAHHLAAAYGTSHTTLAATETAPQEFSVVKGSGDGEVDASWVAPRILPAGRTVSGYQIEHAINADMTSATAVSLSAVTSYTVTGLDDVSNFVRVRAVYDDASTGPWSSTLYATPDPIPVAVPAATYTFPDADATASGSIGAEDGLGTYAVTGTDATLRFDRANGVEAAVGANEICSIMFELLVDAVPASDITFGVGLANGGPRGLHFEVDSFAGGIVNNRVRVNTAFGVDAIEVDNAFAFGTSHHVCITTDGSGGAGAGEVRLYIDGVLAGSSDTATIDVFPTNGAEFMFYCASTSAAGSVRPIGIWDTVLTAEQVQSASAATSTALTVVGLGGSRSSADISPFMDLMKFSAIPEYDFGGGAVPRDATTGLPSELDHPNSGSGSIDYLWANANADIVGVEFTIETDTDWVVSTAGIGGTLTDVETVNGSVTKFTIDDEGTNAYLKLSPHAGKSSATDGAPTYFRVFRTADASRVAAGKIFRSEYLTQLWSKLRCKTPRFLDQASVNGDWREDLTQYPPTAAYGPWGPCWPIEGYPLFAKELKEISGIDHNMWINVDALTSAAAATYASTLKAAMDTHLGSASQAWIEFLNETWNFVTFQNTRILTGKGARDFGTELTGRVSITNGDKSGAQGGPLVIGSGTLFESELTQFDVVAFEGDPLGEAYYVVGGGAESDTAVEIYKLSGPSNYTDTTLTNVRMYKVDQKEARASAEAKIATPIAQAFASEFSGADRSRLKLVLAGQLADNGGVGNANVLERKLDATLWAASGDANYVAQRTVWDAGASSAYFGFDYENTTHYTDPTTGAKALYQANGGAPNASTRATISAYLQDTSSTGPITRMASSFEAHHDLLAPSGMEYLIYEGNQHVVDAQVAAAEQTINREIWEDWLMSTDSTADWRLWMDEQIKWCHSPICLFVNVGPRSDTTLWPVFEGFPGTDNGIVYALNQLSSGTEWHTAGQTPRVVYDAPSALTATDTITDVSIETAGWFSQHADTFSITGAPPGWSINSSTGVIKGTATNTSTTTYSVAVSAASAGSVAVTHTATVEVTYVAPTVVPTPMYSADLETVPPASSTTGDGGATYSPAGWTTSTVRQSLDIDALVAPETASTDYAYAFTLTVDLSAQTLDAFAIAQTSWMSHVQLYRNGRVLGQHGDGVAQVFTYWDTAAADTHRIGIEVDGTNGVYRLYIDGVLEGSESGVTFGSSNSATTFHLGGQGASVINNGTLVGATYRDFKVWNETLSAAEWAKEFTDTGLPS